jgi:transcriptional regulator with XRE-family HTH domain
MPRKIIKRSGFGKFITELRKGRGMRVVDMAKALDYSGAFMTRIERNQSEPSDELIYGFARMFDYPADELFWRAGKIPPYIREAYLKNPEAFHELARKLRSDGAQYGRKQFPS